MVLAGRGICSKPEILQSSKTVFTLGKAMGSTGPNLRNMANVLISLQNFGQKLSEKERIIGTTITMKQDQRVRATNEQCYFNLIPLSRNSK
jgi:hypothetical protein